MLPVGYFGINNDGINLVINLLILFIVVIWFALVYWTYSDARRRIADPMLIFCATAASLFPFVGTVIYMIVRPPEYLDDVRERELEMEASEARLAALQTLCVHCDHLIERDFLICPNCLNRLKDPCQNCRKPLEQSWTLCPYCENPARPKDYPPAEPRRTRRRRVTADDVIAGEAPPTVY
ncbi:MAG: zinc ribbon domain-containing protein [Solirubrobacteraceae bacterium]